MTAPRRFLEKTALLPPYVDGCVKWLGCTRKDGYGSYYLGGRIVLAHRAAYYYATGTMPPPETKVCHKCDNPWCVNPSHLFLGTQADNVKDMISKGRAKRRGVSGSGNSQAKLTEKQVEIIRSGRFKGRDLARAFGVSESTISMVKRGHNWNATRRSEMRLTT